MQTWQNLNMLYYTIQVRVWWIFMNQYLLYSIAVLRGYFALLIGICIQIWQFANAIYYTMVTFLYRGRFFIQFASYKNRSVLVFEKNYNIYCAIARYLLRDFYAVSKIFLLWVTYNGKEPSRDPSLIKRRLTAIHIF